MKKIKFFALMLLAGATLFTSCNKDEETGPAPTLSFSNYPSGTYEIDFETLGVTTFDLSFVVSVTAEEEISTFTAKKKVGSTTTNITPAPADFAGKTSYTYNYLGTFLENDTYPVTLTFTVTDKADQTTDKVFTVTKKTAATGTPFGAFSSNTNIILGGSAHATLGSFYASSTNAIYLQATAKTNCTLVDFAYFYGSANQATIVAPSDADAATMFTGTTGVSSWSTRNATKFVKLTSFDFTALSATTDIASVTFSTDTKANLLVVGDVVAFKTVANKIGFAKVIACTNADNGTITLDVKVQQ